MVPHVVLMLVLGKDLVKLQKIQRDDALEMKAFPTGKAGLERSGRLV